MLEAFKILGYGPTSHGMNTWRETKDNIMWEEGVARKFPGSSKKFPDATGPLYGRKEFDQLLGKYEVVSDVNVLPFAKELIEAYPEAKVVIVEREVESWFKSFQAAWTCYDHPVAEKVVATLDAEMEAITSLCNAISKGYFKAKNKKELLANEREIYKQHYAEIRRITPPERLLDFKLADGWGPLCKFLEKDVPEGIPFPRINDSKDFERTRQITIELMLRRFVGLS